MVGMVRILEMVEMLRLVSMFRKHLNWFVKYMRTFCPRGLPMGEVEF